MVKVGVIGLGNMGRLHMMNCYHVDNVELVAAADTSKKALNRAENFGVQNLFTDYHEMLRNSSLDLDVAIISLPNHLHLDSVQLALESGLDVFIEKPMANTVEDCKKIINLEKKSGRKIMVGYYMRFIRFIEKLKDLAEKGLIGDLEAITLEEVTNGPFSHPAIPKPVPEWWFSPEKIGGGVVVDLGSHLIDLYRFFVGDAKVRYSLLEHKLDLPIEDSAIIILDSIESSTKGIINVGWYQKSSFPNFNFRTILHGNAGFLTSDMIRPSLYFNAMKEGTKNIFRRLSGKSIRPLSYSEIFEAYYKELEQFFDCIKKDTDPIITSNDGLKGVEIIEAIYNKKLGVNSNA